MEGARAATFDDFGPLVPLRPVASRPSVLDIERIVRDADLLNLVDLGAGFFRTVDRCCECSTLRLELFDRGPLIDCQVIG